MNPSAPHLKEGGKERRACLDEKSRKHVVSEGLQGSPGVLSAFREHQP